MEKLNKKRLARELEELNINAQRDNYVFLNKTASTFDTDAEIVAARYQTHGRGRLDRSFFSPKGGIYFCVKAASVPLMTISVAAGVMRALVAAGLNPRVKWVNDILVDNKKVCGILCKSVAQHAVAGIGINYCIKKFPAFLKNKAGSLFIRPEGINNFAAVVIKEVLSACEEGKTHENLLYYRQKLAGLNQQIILPDGSVGILTGVDDDGSLICLKNDRPTRFIYGDIYI